MNNRNQVRFPRAYTALVRLLGVDFNPGHFFDLLVLAFVGAAFAASVLTMGGISQNDSVLAPRLLAAAGALHAYAQVTRAVRGVRIRWMGAALLPFALWVLLDSRFYSVAAWRGREQGMVALTAALAFWVTLHHLRHRGHKWFLLGGMGLLASIFGALVMGGGHSVVARLARRTVDATYEGQATGPFGTPAEYGAFLLLCLFPAGAVLASPSLRNRRRVAAGYAVLLGYIGLWAARHAPTWYGFLAGCAILALLLIPRRRIALIVITALAGLAFFVPKLAKLDSGLFRTVDSRSMEAAAQTPLPQAALDMLNAHPVTGVGSGAFPSAFESVRPWGWHYDPLTAGGFFHQLLAENGLAGFLLLALPGLALWIGAFVLCWKIPVRLTRVDRQFKLERVYTPEPRMALAGVLAGTLAASVALGLDYPRPSVALALGFAVCAAIATREVFGKRFSTTVNPEPNPRLWLRSLVAGVPVAAFVFFVFPVFESADQARRAEDFVSIVEQTTPTGKNANVTRGFVNRSLDVAQEAATDALRTVPDNARAAAALARIHAARYRSTGKPAAPVSLGQGLACARFAAERSAYEPTLSLHLVTSLRMRGDTAGAAAALATLREKAPRNIPLALEQARAHIENGRPDLAAPVIGEILRAQPWNREALRLNALTTLSTESTAR